MMPDNKKSTGTTGERLAAKFLRDNDFEVIEMNFQNQSGRKIGEIDIIAEDTRTNELVFVEVKTRNLQKYRHTLPEENITYSKLKSLSRIAEVYLRKKRWEDRPYRFDAVSVWLDEDNKRAEIKHIRGL